MMTDFFDRHEKIALSFSGGKDSFVCLYLLEPWWDKLTVYWLNPGNPFPETVELMKKVQSEVPHFKEVRGIQPQIIQQDGWPSDVVPHLHTTDGNLIFGKTDFKVQSRLQCCIRSMMMPLYRAMIEDGITCCVRGKRKEEKDKTGLETGFVTDEGIELVFPIFNWTKEEVFKFLELRNIELPEYYKHAEHSLDCMDCTAWWGEGLSKYLLAKHPEAYVEYTRRVHLIKRAVNKQMLDCEV